MGSMVVGDVRLSDRGDWLVERIVTMGSLVLRQIGGDRAGEIAGHRFLDNGRVSAGAIVDALSWRTREACSGRRVIAVQDTTEVNFAGRERARQGLGPAGNGVALGFFIHPLVAVDGDDEAVLGLVDATIWTRDGAAKPDRRERRFEDKEARRWLDGAVSAAQRLGAAREVIVVGDRESDIYPVFARRPAAVGLIVRVAQNRRLATKGLLFDASLDAHGTQTVAVRAKPGQKAREATSPVGRRLLRCAAPHSDRSGPSSHRHRLTWPTPRASPGEETPWPRPRPRAPPARSAPADELADSRATVFARTSRARLGRVR